jgi:hypothetical protein
MCLKRTEYRGDKINVPETSCENKNMALIAWVGINELKKIYASVTYSHARDEKGVLLAGIHTVLSTRKSYLSDSEYTQLNR